MDKRKIISLRAGRRLRGLAKSIRILQQAGKRFSPDPQDPTAVKELKQALTGDPVMSRSLEKFIRKIYRDKACMAGGATTHERIYARYARLKPEKVNDWYSTHQFFVEMNNAVSSKMKQSAFFQESGKSFYSGISNLGMGLWFDKSVGDEFLFFKVSNTPVTHRTYANVKREGLIQAVNWLEAYTEAHPDHGIQSFKIAGCAEADFRSDALVVYSRDAESAETVGRAMAQELSGLLNKKVPSMTKVLAKGVSTGAEPKSVSVGLRPIDGSESQSLNSFGTLRAELIESAILHYNDNKHAYPQTFDTFKRFVVAAFKGYGLDPEHPSI